MAALVSGDIKMEQDVDEEFEILVQLNSVTWSPSWTNFLEWSTMET